jgi:hypothetical protein
MIWLSCASMDGLAELLLFEGVQTQTRFVEQEDRIVQLPPCLSAEHHEEADKPAEAVAALIEFDLNAKIVLHDDLQVLPVRLAEPHDPAGTHA